MPATIRLGVLLLFLAGLIVCHVGSAAENQEVIVVYNKQMPESKRLAEYYSEKRQIPASHLLGLDLPKIETITRKDFEEKLQAPLLKQLEDKKWLVFGNIPLPNQPGKQGKVPIAASVRYAVMCYGVPVKILPDLAHKDTLTGKVPQQYNRNEAAVDSELSTLPLAYLDMPLTGPHNNVAYGTTNLHHLHPTNGVLMVARLDGPTVEIAQGLVDKALMAETFGLWGRAYFDSRGLNDGPYKLGDDWIKTAAQHAKTYGYETILHESSGTFPTGYPLSHIALYFGWYDHHASGPFMEPGSEFMPGAVAYHLHSFSAQVVRTRDLHWVGPLLAAGATATMGCTEEPYLDGTPDLPAFLSRFMFLGFSFGEAGYAAQRTISWQTTFIGDPLYRPFGRKPVEIYDAAMKIPGSPTEWATEQLVNRLLIRNEPTETITDYLEKNPLTKQSAVLSEKLGDVYRSKGKLPDSIEPYLQALRLNPSPKQRLRISLVVGRLLGNFDRPQDAYDIYMGLTRDYANYPEMRDVYAKLADVALALGKKNEADDFRQKSRPAPPGSSNKK